MKVEIRVADVLGHRAAKVVDQVLPRLRRHVLGCEAGAESLQHLAYVVQLEDVPGLLQGLAIACQVHERDEAAVARELGPQQAVLEDDAVRPLDHAQLGAGRDLLAGDALAQRAQYVAGRQRTASGATLLRAGLRLLAQTHDLVRHRPGAHPSPLLYTVGNSKQYCQQFCLQTDLRHRSRRQPEEHLAMETISGTSARRRDGADECPAPVARGRRPQASLRQFSVNDGVNSRTRGSAIASPSAARGHLTQYRSASRPGGRGQRRTGVPRRLAAMASGRRPPRGADNGGEPDHLAHFAVEHLQHFQRLFAAATTRCHVVLMFAKTRKVRESVNCRERQSRVAPYLELA
jgi:hypothetical protein